MKRVVIFLCTLVLLKGSLQAVEFTAKAGLAQQQLSGFISNIYSESTFENDLAYDKSYTSLFSLELRDIYIPNIKLLYFNTQESASSTLTQSIVIAQNRFEKDSNVFSQIKYNQFNALLYKDFFLKGNYILSNSLYTGDIEIDLGINTQYTRWDFNIQSLTNPTQPKAWIDVKSFIASPYLAFKYYFYRIKMELFGDALAYKDEKILHYGATIEYNFARGILLSVGYTYNEFELTEKKDKVNFKSSGMNFMFGYRF